MSVLSFKTEITTEEKYMESRKQTISAKYNKKIQIGVIPGHFATNHSHINY